MQRGHQKCLIIKNAYESELSLVANEVKKKKKKKSYAV